ncbi:DNA topoisomerase VI subunit B [Candidatus Bathyarchaeota archaeon ex4484_205]|nr:MAG: DNA topoisomerase VI subunit B [Candidatus Bathyarchaeota archaeon ex4484_205]
MSSIREAAKLEATRMQSVNPAQYFERNLHQLGFGDPEHALLQTLKELTDNALDAAEAGNILPEVKVNVIALDKTYDFSRLKERRISARFFKVSVEDNGIGILPDRIADCFGTLLYGSKFFILRQSRGQQGVGASAALLYSQLTSLQPAVIISKISGGKAIYVELKIDVEKNKPDILVMKETKWNKKHGTRIELITPGRFTARVERYFRELAIGNPHATIMVRAIKEPDGDPIEVKIERAIEYMPRKPLEIKPHLLSLDPGTLQRMAEMDKCCRTAASFLAKHFSMISPKTARKLLFHAKLPPHIKPSQIKADRIVDAAKKVNIRRPPLNVLSEIGAENLEKALWNIYPDAEFVAAHTRPPWSYRGIPFQIEVAVVYGGESVQRDVSERPGKFKVIRLANRVPLPYDSSDCLLYRCVGEVNWKNYGLKIGDHGTITDPIIFVVSIVASKVPYTSAGKFAVAHDEDIKGETILALQEIGRRLRMFLSRRRKIIEKERRYEYFKEFYKLISEEVKLITGEEVTPEVTLERLFEEVRS